MHIVCNSSYVIVLLIVFSFFSHFPSRWHCIVLCCLLHLSSIELQQQQPQRRSLFNIRRQHRSHDAPVQARNNGYGNGLEAFIRDGRCALVIPPGQHGYVLHNFIKTSRYKFCFHFSFLFFAHSPENCVTFESVDRAFHTARQRISGPYPKGRSMTDLDVDTLGHMIVETSRLLATEWVMNLHFHLAYGMTNDVTLYLVWRIDKVQSSSQYDPFGSAPDRHSTDCHWPLLSGLSQTTEMCRQAIPWIQRSLQQSGKRSLGCHSCPIPQTPTAWLRRW